MLIRHYFEQAVMEAHKVLGGTGPAIAQIPLTVLWTGGTLFDLTVDLASRRAGALSALPRMGFITFTASAQLIGVASKMAAAFLAVLPYYREGDYSDAAAVARYVVRPQHAVEAFSMATKALFQVSIRQILVSMRTCQEFSNLLCRVGSRTSTSSRELLEFPHSKQYCT